MLGSYCLPVFILLITNEEKIVSNVAHFRLPSAGVSKTRFLNFPSDSTLNALASVFLTGEKVMKGEREIIDTGWEN